MNYLDILKSPQTIHTNYGRDISYKLSHIGNNNRLLLCLHDFGDDKNSSVIDALTDDPRMPCAVMAFDWPAHGESTAPDEELTVENCLQDLDEVVQFINKAISNMRLSCFATGFGGYIATIYRSTHPDAFEQLILRSPALKMDEIARSLISDEDYAIVRDGGRISMGFDRKMLLGRSFFDSLSANQIFDAPVPNPINVMIIQGDKDEIVNPEDTRQYTEKNHIMLNMIPGVDHRYENEGDIDSILEAAIGFLTMQFSISDYGVIYRIYKPITVDYWDEEHRKWAKEEHSGQTYYDITGRGGGWDQYNDLTPEAALERVLERGGTIEDFLSVDSNNS